MQGVVCLLCISISWLLDTIVLHFKKICHLLFRLLCSSISLLLNTIVFHFKRTAILFLWHGIKQTSCFFFSFYGITKSLKLPFQLHIHPSVPVKNRNGNTIRSWLPTELLSNRGRNCHCHLPLKFSISVALLPFAFPFVPYYSILYITSLPNNSQDTQAFFAHSDNSQLISLATYWLRPLAKGKIQRILKNGEISNLFQRPTRFQNQ